MIYPEISAIPFPPEVPAEISGSGWYSNTREQWATPAPYSAVSVFPPYYYDYIQADILTRRVYQAFCVTGQKDHHVITWQENGNTPSPGNFDEMLLRFRWATNPPLRTIPLYTTTYAEWENIVLYAGNINTATHLPLIKDQISDHLISIPDVWHDVLQNATWYRDSRHYWDREGFDCLAEFNGTSITSLTASWTRQHINNVLAVIEFPAIVTPADTIPGSGIANITALLLLFGAGMMGNASSGKRLRRNSQ